MSESFANVDQSANPSAYVNCMNEQHAKNSKLQAHKQRTLELCDIRPNQTILDVGCGTGIDAAKMAQQVGPHGRVVGIDLSAAMIAAAEQQLTGSNLPLTFQQGSIYQLNFPDNTFDCVRADKTFQHLADPHAALVELLRVTKPGGTLVIADPDHDSLIIDTPFADINRRFIHFRSDAMAQGGIAHKLYGMLKALGVIDVHIEPLTTVYTNYAEKVASPYLKEIWVAEKHGVVTSAEAQQWADYLQTAIDNDRFLCIQTYTITVATLP